MSSVHILLTLNISLNCFISIYRISYFDHLQCFITSRKHQSTLLAFASLSKISSEKVCFFFSFCAISLDSVPSLKLANRCMATGWAEMSKMHILKFIPFSTHNLRIATLCRKQNDSDQKILPFHKTKSTKNKVWSHQQTMSSFWGGGGPKNDHLSNWLGYYKKEGSIS